MRRGNEGGKKGKKRAAVGGGKIKKWHEAAVLAKFCCTIKSERMFEKEGRNERKNRKGRSCDLSRTKKWVKCLGK